MPKLGDGLPYLGGNGLIATARETMAIVFRAFSSPFLANRLSQHLLSRNWREVYQKPTRQGDVSEMILAGLSTKHRYLLLLLNNLLLRKTTFTFTHHGFQNVDNITHLFS